MHNLHIFAWLERKDDYINSCEETMNAQNWCFLSRCDNGRTLSKWNLLIDGNVCTQDLHEKECVQ